MIIVDRDFAPEWEENVPLEEYHADKSSVSSTGLMRILKSPRAFKNSVMEARYVKPKTAAMSLGTMLHHALLEGGDFQSRYVCMPNFAVEMGMHPNKNEVKAAKAQWLKEVYATQPDAVIVAPEQRDKILFMIESVLGHEDAMFLLRNGKPEISGYFADEETGILCRIRPDFLQHSAEVLVDIKTTRNCSRTAFARSVWDYRYDFSMAMYMEGCRIINGKKVEIPAWIAVENQGDYECSVYYPDQGTLEFGLNSYRAAQKRLAAALETDTWKSYQAKAEMIALPHYAFAKPDNDELAEEMLPEMEEVE